MSQSDTTSGGPRLTGLTATGIGSMPGEDFAATASMVLDAVPLPFVPELPARGVEAQLVGRTLGLIDELGFDLQPAGWRVAGGPGVDQRRARSLIARDLDEFTAALGGAQPACVKVQVAGPWTLASQVERPRGDKVLGELGLRRDLAQALAEAVAAHVADVARRTGAPRIVLQIDEPMLPAVRSATVPTASGFARHRAVDAPDAAAALGWLTERLDTAGLGETARVVHCCADAVPYDVLSALDLDALAIDATRVSGADLEALGAWVDSGRHVWAGIVTTSDTDLSDARLIAATRRVWDSVGIAQVGAITPTCGLAGAGRAYAGRALEASARVADRLAQP